MKIEIDGVTLCMNITTPILNTKRQKGVTVIATTIKGKMPCPDCGSIEEVKYDGRK